MDKARGLAIWTAALLMVAVLVPLRVCAQESLDAILDRGFVAHWLVCGPFQSDVPGGVLGALESDSAALGDTDFMATRGGIARIRPEHLMRIETPEGGEAIWQRAGTPEPELDLKPFFPASPAGVAYAAFYANAAQNTAIFLDVQTPLGLRLWANGFPIQEYAPEPFDEAGLSQAAIPLRAGMNLIVMEVPGADYDALARTLGLSTQQLTASSMANRPRLRKTSGFAISALVKPARPLGNLYFVPDIEDAGTFSGGPGDERQDAWLTLYNPGDNFSEPIDVLVSTPGTPIPDLIEVEPIAARTAARVPMALPIQDAANGAALSISVRMHSGGAESSFIDTIIVRPGTEQQGIVRVITGHTPSEPGVASAGNVFGDALDSQRNQLLFVQETGGYGFDLRHAAAWHVPYVAFPDLRSQLLTAVQQGAVTVRAPYAPIDERIASGTLLWRNLQIGLGMARGILQSTVPQQLAWNAPGVAPQTPQLLSLSPVKGFISNIMAAGLQPLGEQLDLSGGFRLHRHKQSASGPGSAEGLQEMAAVQRRELLALGLPSDVLVLENIVPAPEPFYRGSLASLARAFPRIVLDEGGGAAFFEDATAADETLPDGFPPQSVYLNQGKPGDLLSWPALKSTQASVSQSLFTAETLASLASLQGATYPHAALDFASRQVLFYSTPEFLAAPATRDDALDTLAGYREASELLIETTNKSLAYLAEKIDTGGSAPLNQGTFQAIVVFNPGSQPANLAVEILLPQTTETGFTLVDATGTPVPFSVRPYQQAPLLEFVAPNVPSFGYGTWFVKAGGTRSEPVIGTDLQIENESLALFLDSETGAIASITDKRSGRKLDQGLLNRLQFLSEDESRNQGGRELWTRPADEPVSPAPGIRSEHTAFRERIIVTRSMRGGTVEQQYTLDAGQPWVACETRLLGVNLSDVAAFATFQFPDESRSLVFGERFGAITGARGNGDGAIQTHDTDYEGGIVAYPASEWVAITPHDVIQVGRDGVVPWEPAILLHGADPLLKNAAEKLQAALIARGIPSIVQSDQPMKPDFLWTDSTTEVDSNAYLARGYRMRVVIGSPDQNTFCNGLMAQLSAADAAEFSNRIQQGARIFLNDINVPVSVDPVPTLMLAGITPTQSAALTDTLTNSIASGQSYLLPPSAYVPGSPAKVAESGAALLFPRSMSVSQHRDGRLFLGLAHRSALDDSTAGKRLALLMGELRFNYAIYPFEGSWRDADVPARAEAAFLAAPAVLTGIHPGPLPIQQSFLSLDTPGLRIAGLKPAAFPVAANAKASFHPRNGFTLLAWESLGGPWQGRLSGTMGFLEGRGSDVYEATKAPLVLADGNAMIESRGFQIQPLWLLPRTTTEQDALSSLGRESDPYGTLQTRYWDEHRGAAPLQNLPIGILLRGSLEGKSPVLEVVVSNHLQDEPVEGMAILSASNGTNIGPGQFFFSLPPGRQHVEPIQLAYTPDAGEDRAVAVETSYARQTYRDVIMTNDAPYALTLSRNGAQLRVEIRNESSIHAEGYLDIIASPAFWPELGGYPSTTILPRRAAVSVPPYKVQTVLFTVSEPDATFESCIKLSANGKVMYEYFDAAAAPVLLEPMEPETERTAPVPPPPRRR